MNELMQKLQNTIDQHAKKLFDVACDIYDHPELGMEEEYASDLLCKLLEEYGFAVERGVAGMPTAFIATYENGEGGPVVGLIGEYDALEDLGHACGHHLQTPACIAAAEAVKEAMGDAPYKLIIFGTPAEETGGGKVLMVEAGCFDNVDFAINWHCGRGGFVSYKNKANLNVKVVFTGIPSHASSGPEKGRSALDAMLLSFQGLEFMREHIGDGCRIHYTIAETTGPANIIHPRAVAKYTLRALDKEYLDDMYKRFLNIIEGASLMTDVKYEIFPSNMYYELLPNETLRDALLDSMEEVGVPLFSRVAQKGGGSTDFGNLTWKMPAVMYQTFYCAGSAHTISWLEVGKAQAAYDAYYWGALAMAHFACKYISDSDLRARAKSEFEAATMNCKRY